MKKMRFAIMSILLILSSVSFGQTKPQSDDWAPIIALVAK